jgi:hypothetical protein
MAATTSYWSRETLQVRKGWREGHFDDAEQALWSRQPLQEIACSGVCWVQVSGQTSTPPVTRIALHQKQWIKAQISSPF